MSSIVEWQGIVFILTVGLAAGILMARALANWWLTPLFTAIACIAAIPLAAILFAIHAFTPLEVAVNSGKMSALEGALHRGEQQEAFESRFGTSLPKPDFQRTFGANMRTYRVIVRSALCETDARDLTVTYDRFHHVASWHTTAVTRSCDDIHR
jgi:hypothetical protein